LSVNDLPKIVKIAVFSTERPFRDQHPLFFGVKIRIFLYKLSFSQIAIRVYQARTFAMPNGNNYPRVCVPEVTLSRPFAMPISNNHSDESAPERGNEPPAQGTALGDKGKITEGALTGQKLYH